MPGWLSRNNFSLSDFVHASDLNNLANDNITWGGDVNGGGYHLSNVILQGSGGFSSYVSPVEVTPGSTGSSCVQLDQTVGANHVARWTVLQGYDRRSRQQHRQQLRHQPLHRCGSIHRFAHSDQPRDRPHHDGRAAVERGGQRGRQHAHQRNPFRRLRAGNRSHDSRDQYRRGTERRRHARSRPDSCGRGVQGIGRIPRCGRCARSRPYGWDERDSCGRTPPLRCLPARAAGRLTIGSTALWWARSRRST